MPKIAQNRPNLLNPKSPEIVENHLDFLHPNHAPSSPVHPIGCSSSPPFFSICSGFLSFFAIFTETHKILHPKSPKIAQKCQTQNCPKLPKIILLFLPPIMESPKCWSNCC
ncbi:hypothetical protein SLEP1_g20004 [Rubroshorea leprosula]|uniref:Uncharacterized protein n=1 Tax=Rubroshorea leprosula TaxID=152421 RepID=A0AAV5J180_9ROSI|nr:hypothetical protein SLEP1_g20004 [Rubroshorea leprosula]